MMTAKTFHHIDFEYKDLITETKDGKRKYVTPKGKKYPSITTVLGNKNKDSLIEWKKRVGEKEANRVSRLSSSKGTKMHDAAERYLRGEEVKFQKFDHLAKSNFLSIKETLDKRIDNIYCLEFPLYSDYLKIAGRVDCIAEFDGIISVIDFKTSAKPKKREWITNYFIQESAYSIMFEERTEIPITQLVTIIAVDYFSKPEIFIEHRDNWAPQLIEDIKNFFEEQKEEKNL